MKKKKKKGLLPNGIIYNSPVKLTPAISMALLLLVLGLPISTFLS